MSQSLGSSCHADTAVYNRAQEAVSSTLNGEIREPETPDSLTLVDQYVALLMATFIESGLLEVGNLCCRATHRVADSELGPGCIDRREHQFSESKGDTPARRNAAEGESYIAAAVRCTGTGMLTRSAGPLCETADEVGLTQTICRVHGFHKPSYPRLCSFRIVLNR